MAESLEIIDFADFQLKPVFAEKHSIGNHFARKKEMINIGEIRRNRMDTHR